MDRLLLFVFVINVFCSCYPTRRAAEAFSYYRCISFVGPNTPGTGNPA